MNAEPAPGGLQRLRPWWPVLLVLLLAFAAAFGLQQRRDSQERETMQRLRALVAQSSLEMISTEDCLDCRRLLEWFRSEKVAVRECRVGREPRCAEQLQASGAERVPVFVVGGRVQVKGFDIKGLLVALEKEAKP